jgi:arginine deiminase
MVTQSAFGGHGWQPRTKSLSEEIGSIWHSCGVNNEWSDLKAILVHAPGQEIAGISDPNAFQMLAPIDAALVKQQHREMVKKFEERGVSVFYVNPSENLLPNQMFAADLFFMTPEGVIIARPASVVRSGEERWVARRMAEIGIPILGSIHGHGTFEGADAAWLGPQTVMVGVGFRTNRQGVNQLSTLLKTINVELVQVTMPKGIMHLMGMLRIVDRDLCMVRSGINPDTANTLQQFGYKVVHVPNSEEVEDKMAFNFVTLRPRAILMPRNNPITQSLFEKHGITCDTADVSELIKAAGAIGCLSGIMRRDSI